MTLKTDIHTKEDLNKLMLDEAGIRDPLDQVQLRFILIPDFEPDRAVVLVKAHHCMSDGVGFGALMLAISGAYTASALPGVKSTNILFRMLMHLLFPFLVAYALYTGSKDKNDYNSIRKSLPLTGRKQAAFSKDIDMPAIKAWCKKNSCTVNDYSCAILSSTMYEYFERYQEQDG